MSKKCVWCGGIAVYLGFAGVRYYCPHCEETLTEDEVINDMTVFERITESPETLAEKLVYCHICGWTSYLLNFHTLNRDEAIAATVAKLKEIEE